MYDRCPPLTRPDLGPTPTWSGSGADGPKTRSQMFVGVSPPGCLWWQSQSYGRFSSRGRGQSWCSRQEGHRGAPRSFILLPQMGQLQLVLPRLLQRCHALALGAFLPGFAAPQPTQKPFSGKKKRSSGRRIMLHSSTQPLPEPFKAGRRLQQAMGFFRVNKLVNSNCLSPNTLLPACAEQHRSPRLGGTCHYRTVGRRAACKKVHVTAITTGV